MFSINTNNNALAALQSLNSTAAMLAETQNAVSTGQKVSSAQDNPAIYSISQTMNANIAGLAAVSDSLNLGSSVMKVATQAASSISSNLASLQQTVTQAQQTGLDPITMQNQVNAALSQISEFAKTATFNGVNLLATTAVSGGTSGSVNVVQDVNGGTLAIASTLGANANILQALGLQTTGAPPVNLQVAASAVQITPAAGTALAANNDKVVLGSTTSTGTAGPTDTFEFITAGTALTSVNSATNTVHAVLITAGETQVSQLADLATAMNAAGYNAALDTKGNLDVTGKGAAISAAGALTGTTSSIAAGGGWGSTAIMGGTAAVAIVQSAVSKMNTISASLGSSQQQVTGMASFTTQLSAAQTSGVGALTDADLAAESAKLTSLQTKQSLAIQSLSIANSQPQALLTLFR